MAPKTVDQKNRWIVNAKLRGALTAPTAAAMRRHALVHSEKHVFAMLRMMVNEKRSFSEAHAEATRMVGK